MPTKKDSQSALTALVASFRLQAAIPATAVKLANLCSTALSASYVELDSTHRNHKIPPAWLAAQGRTPTLPKEPQLAHLATLDASRLETLPLSAQLALLVPQVRRVNQSAQTAPLALLPTLRPAQAVPSARAANFPLNGALKLAWNATVENSREALAKLPAPIACRGSSRIPLAAPAARAARLALLWARLVPWRVKLVRLGSFKVVPGPSCAKIAPPESTPPRLRPCNVRTAQMALTL